MTSKTVALKEKSPRPISENAAAGAHESAAGVALNPALSDQAASPAPAPTAISRAIETLVSTNASFLQKHEVWNQLRKAGQLDQAIAALKQGITDHPDSVFYPAELGQAQLQKAEVILENGGKISEMGILGMQADQNFDAALELDPNNWEAQFFKVAAMSHWPLELNKSEEVVQRLSRLIDQQEKMSSEPQFAQSYVLLGNQYQKLGQPEYAAATWRLGAQKFPNAPSLQAKLNGE